MLSYHVRKVDFERREARNIKFGGNRKYIDGKENSLGYILGSVIEC